MSYLFIQHLVYQYIFLKQFVHIKEATKHIATTLQQMQAFS